VYESDKNEALSRIIDSEVDIYAIVFCKTRRECDQLAQWLNDRGCMASSLHGDMDQREREKVMNAFKKKKSTLLIATDIAAR
jgi:ATP-dependent RNA helicase DeaD